MKAESTQSALSAKGLYMFASALEHMIKHILHQFQSGGGRLYPDKPELSEDENPYLKDIREKNCFTSYEELVEDGYEGATVQNEAEVRILYEELLDAAKKVANYYPSVIRYTIEGYNKREIIGKLGLEDNSSNYRKIDKALKFAHDYLTE